MGGSRHVAVMLVALLACALVVVGCGGGSDDGEQTQADEAPPIARAEDFPQAQGRTLAQIQREVGDSGPVLAPTVSRLKVGKNRYGFGLFDRSRAQITDARVALYVAPADGGPAEGPFVARWESLAVKPQFQSRSVSLDADSAKSLYVTSLAFDKRGSYQVLGVARLDKRLVAATPAGPPLEVVTRDSVPSVGDPAPRTSTPTVEDVSGDLAKIDTRVPPSTMHEEDLVDVLGKKPAVLLFATPALCQSRVCGPVVDIAEQVKATYGDDAAFIHMEIFNDNTVEKGYRKQVLDWKLPTEPWAFTIDAEGRVAARLEGAFSAEELKRAVEKAIGE